MPFVGLHNFALNASRSPPGGSVSCNAIPLKCCLFRPVLRRSGSQLQGKEHRGTGTLCTQPHVAVAVVGGRGTGHRRRAGTGLGTGGIAGAGVAPTAGARARVARAAGVHTGCPAAALHGRPWPSAG
ncbi:hypothetical protein G6F62_013338 [Rhizopus arrhizus]|nr:hypothetical protein G6F62_013338 [Rhizopus arrhizus]KAG1388765.1 hypothetical protein G6F60_013589 [Rhizopus arrhizus]